MSALILGLGESGLAMARWLAREGWALRVADTRAAPPMLAALREHVPAAEFAGGAFNEALLDGVTMLALSPGLAPEHSAAAPLVHAAQARGIEVVGEIELFARALKRLAEVRGYRPRIVGITGTNGKTTTTVLTGLLIDKSGVAGKNGVAVAGNISPTALDTLRERLDLVPMNATDSADHGNHADDRNNAADLPQVWVLELSSFQLATTSSLECDAAAVLNLTQDHLDWHGSMEAYAAAKARIFGSRTARVLNRDDAWLVKMQPAPVKPAPKLKASRAKALRAEKTHVSVAAVAPAAMLASSVQPADDVSPAQVSAQVSAQVPAQVQAVSERNALHVAAGEVPTDLVAATGDARGADSALVNVDANAQTQSDAALSELPQTEATQSDATQSAAHAAEHVERALKRERELPPPVITFGAGAPTQPDEYGLVRDGGLMWLAVTEDMSMGHRRRKAAAELPGIEGQVHVHRLMPTEALKIRGRHNALNALTALALARAIGCPLAPMLHALRHYTGEPHRVQPVAVVDGVHYVDDSKGTNVGATVAALEGLGNEGRKLVVILGGEGKGQDFAPLAAPLAAFARGVVLIGRDGPRIGELLREAAYPVNSADALADAVELAAGMARPGDVVLLSPACASLDMFRNYKHRAEVFAAAVRELATEKGQVL